MGRALVVARPVRHRARRILDGQRPALRLVASAPYVRREGEAARLLRAVGALLGRAVCALVERVGRVRL